MKKLYTLLTLATLLVAMSSCGDDYYRDSELLGRWQMISVIENGYEYELEIGEYEEYTFYRDGTGLYINEFGTRVDFYWDQRGYDRIEMRFADGMDEYPYYEFDRGDLILWDTASRRTGRVFRYYGYY